MQGARRLWLLGFLFLFFAGPVLADTTQALPRLSERDQAKLMISGWYTWVPYQYKTQREKGKGAYLTGLDIMLVQAILERAGFRVQHHYVNWKRHQLDLKAGRRDLAAGAFFSDDRAQYAYYSEPYREESNELYLKRGEAKKYPFQNVDEMLKLFKARNFRLGIINGYKYASPKINAFINDPNNKHLLFPAQTETENFKKLFKNKIDGFLVDRLVGATLSWKNHWQSKVEAHPNLLVSDKIYAIFSKKTTNPALVNRFNQALHHIKKTGKYKQIVMDYTFPILLAITVEKSWFFAVDLIGTVAFAISGLLLAHREKYSFVGAFVLAVLPAMGGGVMRDLTLNRHPVGLLRTPSYIITVLITLIIFYLFVRLYRSLKRHAPRLTRKIEPWNLTELSLTGVRIFDSLGLSSFTIVGVVIIVNANLHPLLLWGPIFAVATSIGGGVMRDVLRGDKNIVFLKGEIYPELSIVWGSIFCLFLNQQIEHLNPNAVFIAVLVTLFGCFISRLLVMYFNIKTLIF